LVNIRPLEFILLADPQHGFCHVQNFTVEQLKGDMCGKVDDMFVRFRNTFDCAVIVSSMFYLEQIIAFRKFQDAALGPSETEFVTS
tara:strand:- start:346 stop:603 length:258 start_codon:yes stop_codon:yes gene_type:complete